MRKGARHGRVTHKSRVIVAQRAATDRHPTRFPVLKMRSGGFHRPATRTGSLQACYCNGGGNVLTSANGGGLRKCPSGVGWGAPPAPDAPSAGVRHLRGWGVGAPAARVTVAAATGDFCHLRAAPGGLWRPTLLFAPFLPHGDRGRAGVLYLIWLPDTLAKKRAGTRQLDALRDG